MRLALLGLLCGGPSAFIEALRDRDVALLFRGDRHRCDEPVRARVPRVVRRRCGFADAREIIVSSDPRSSARPRYWLLVFELGVHPSFHVFCPRVDERTCCGDADVATNDGFDAAIVGRVRGRCVCCGVDVRDACDSGRCAARVAARTGRRSHGGDGFFQVHVFLGRQLDMRLWGPAAAAIGRRQSALACVPFVQCLRFVCSAADNRLAPQSLRIWARGQGVGGPRAICRTIGVVGSVGDGGVVSGARSHHGGQPVQCYGGACVIVDKT
mmetsp:Transcript_3626/g.10897  ORF Transcript_3626/g.10897 Transcript_3626/m.10897 type:complete len:269 (-) Transcript_3626:443-1249(-)